MILTPPPAPLVERVATAGRERRLNSAAKSPSATSSGTRVHSSNAAAAPLPSLQPRSIAISASRPYWALEERDGERRLAVGDGISGSGSEAKAFWMRSKESSDLPAMRRRASSSSAVGSRASPLRQAFVEPGRDLVAADRAHEGVHELVPQQPRQRRIERTFLGDRHADRAVEGTAGPFRQARDARELLAAVEHDGNARRATFTRRDGEHEREVGEVQLELGQHVRRGVERRWRQPS